MKLAALLSVGLLWLLLLLMMRIGLTCRYRFQDMESRAVINIQILLFHLQVEINIPKEMLTAGLKNIFRNFTEEFAGPEMETCTKGKELEIFGKDNEGEALRKEQPAEMEGSDQATSRRYKKLRHFQQEVGNHYVFSWARLIWIKRKLHRLFRDFYRKVNIYSFQAGIQVGGRDAAETGLLTGVLWAFLGEMAARLNRLVTVKKKDIHLNVLPCFEKETFLCQLNCILTLRISHIIFTAYKFLAFMIKNRRIRTYGRTSH